MPPTQEGFTVPDGPVPRGPVESYAMPWRGDELEGLSPEEKLERETAWHHLSNPKKPLSHRHRELVRLLAAGSMSHLQISEVIGYAPGYISILSCHPKIRAQVSELQDRAFSMGIKERLDSLNDMALNKIEAIISGAEPDAKIKEQLDAARWLLEKTTGKAKQEIETRDSNLTDFMTLLKQLKEETGTSPTQNLSQSAQNLLPEAQEAEFRDVTPEEQKDSLEQWVNLET